MFKKINFKLVLPEKIIFSGKVNSVVVPGIKGDFCVFINHTPMLTTLRVGFLEIKNGTTIDKFFIRDGFVIINNTELVILTEKVIKAIDLTIEFIDIEIKNIILLLKNTSEDNLKSMLCFSLDQLKAIRCTL